MRRREREKKKDHPNSDGNEDDDDGERRSKSSMVSLDELTQSIQIGAMVDPPPLHSHHACWLENDGRIEMGSKLDADADVESR